MGSRKLHDCSVHDVEVEFEDYRILYGCAVTECIEYEDGKLYVSNGEYGNRVNYCPFCGYKAKVQMKLMK